MLTKKWTFEPEPPPEIELELEYSYDYDPGNLSGLPENCWPESEECEIILPKDYEDIILEAYWLEAMEQIKRVEKRIEEMAHSCEEVREWVEEEKESEI